MSGFFLREIAACYQALVIHVWWAHQFDEADDDSLVRL